ncbi:MAG: trypsin-like peptidase domain-containing protein [Syntrophomonas sp.]
MNKTTARVLVYFMIFFLFGLGTFKILNSMPFPGKAAVYKAKEPAGNSVSGVAASVSPSVVGLTNISREGDLFNQRDVEKTGSGVIIDKDGYIVTNNHVVNGANRLIVTLADGNEEDAKIIGTDARTDLALIKIKVDRHVTPAKFGNSDQLVVGEQVVAIGNPLGLRFARSVTAGVVSGINRLLTTEEGFVFRLIQTDAAINPGNSGGALVNLQGEVVGINTIKIVVEGFEGMGFSIPSNQVKTVIDEIKKNGRVLRPLMGIKILGEISQDQARYFQLPVLYGVAVEPLAGGPAAQAGLKKYDIITKLDDDDIKAGSELQEKIFSKKIGQVVTVKVMRLTDNQKGKNELNEFKIKLAK